MDYFDTSFSSLIPGYQLSFQIRLGLGRDLYKEIKLQILPPIFNSKLIHSWRY